jgi:hypothetical protein
LHPKNAQEKGQEEKPKEEEEGLRYGGEKPLDEILPPGLDGGLEITVLLPTSKGALDRHDCLGA